MLLEFYFNIDCKGELPIYGSHLSPYNSLADWNNNHLDKSISKWTVSSLHVALHFFPFTIELIISQLKINLQFSNWYSVLT